MIRYYLLVVLKKPIKFLKNNVSFIFKAASKIILFAIAMYKFKIAKINYDNEVN